MNSLPTPQRLEVGDQQLRVEGVRVVVVEPAPLLIGCLLYTSLDIVVFAVAPVADNQAGVVGVACDGVVEAGLHPQVLHPAAEGVGGGLSGVLGDRHAAHQQALPPESVDEPQHVHVVGDAQIAPDLVLLDVAGADGDDHLHRVPQLLEHTDLAVRLEPGPVSYTHLWKLCEQRRLPRLLYISKTDEENSDYNAAFDTLRERFGKNIAPVAAPIWDADKKVIGFIDVLQMCIRDSTLK